MSSADPRLTVRYCPSCGAPTSRCDGSCRPASDPPRFCPTCGRMAATIVVTPGTLSVRCRDHGELT